MLISCIPHYPKTTKLSLQKGHIYTFCSALSLCPSITLQSDTTATITAVVAQQKDCVVQSYSLTKFAIMHRGHEIKKNTINARVSEATQLVQPALRNLHP